MSEHLADDSFMEESRFVLERADDQVGKLMHARWQQAAIDQTDPQTDLAWQRHMLQQSVEAAIDKHAEPEQRQALSDFRAITDYLWFGRQDTPLPEALTTSTGMFPGEVYLTLNLDRMSPRDYTHCADAARVEGLETLEAHRAQVVERQAASLLRPAVRSMVCNTPGNRLLESFIGELHNLEDQPLPPQRKHLYALQAAQAIRDRWRIPSTTHISTALHPAAKLELDRQVQRIDALSEPQRVTEPEKATPREVARDYLRASAEPYVGRDIPGNTILAIEAYTGHGHTETCSERYETLDITTDKGVVRFVPESIHTWVLDQEGIALPADSLGRLVTERMVTAVALNVFDKQADDSGTYQELLRGLVEENTESIEQGLIEFASKTDTPHFTRRSTMLHRPAEAAVNYGEFAIIERQDVMQPYKQTLTGRRELRELLRKTLGTIVRRPLHDTEARIVSYRSTTTDLAQQHDSATDMIIAPTGELQGNPTQGVYPQVAGYELVSVDAAANTYGYRYRADQDPYAPCHTVISDERLQQLTVAYDRMGFTKLSNVLRDRGDLTVSQFAALVSESGRYYFGADDRQVSIPRKLDDFTSLCAKGTMQLQCVQWAQFLRYSLEQAFGPGSCIIASGPCLPSSGDRIPYIGHAQTSFHDPTTGRIHLLDATPGGFDISLLRTMMGQVGQRIGKLLASRAVAKPEQAAPQRELPEPKVQGTNERHSAAPRLKHELLAANAEQTIASLQMVFGSHKQMLDQDRLFELIVSRGEDDLLFQVVATLKASTTDAPERATPHLNEEVKRLHQRIAALQDCEDPQLLARLDPHRYMQHPWLIYTLQGAIAEAKRLLG